MNKFLALYRVTQKCAKTEEGTKVSNIVGYIILGVIVAVLFGVGGNYAGVLVPTVALLIPGVDIPTNLFMLLFWLSGTFVLFTAFQKLLGAMFMSSDVDILAAMPLSSSQIGLTRVMSCVPLAYATTVCTVLPFTIGYFVSTGFDAYLLVLAIVGVLIIPLGLVSIIAILLTLIMKVFRQVRNRDMLTVLGAIGACVLVIVFNVLTNSVTDASTSGDRAASLLSTLADISNIAWSLPFAACLGKALAGGPLFLLAAIVIVAVFVALLYVVLSALYLPAALGMANARSKANAINDEKLERGSASRSINRALFWKEFKSYFKETNFIQGWIFAIALPLFFLIMSNVSGGDGEPPVGFVSAVVESAKLPLAYSIFLGVTMAISTVGLASAVATTGTSSFSREGEAFDYMKTFPVEYRVQVSAKLKVAMIPLALGGLIYEIIAFAMAIPYGVVNIPMLIAALVTDVFVVILLANLQMRTAARKANLHWSSSQTAIKNTGLWVAIGFVLFFVFSAPAYPLGLLGMFLESMDATIWVYIGSGVLVVLLALAAFLTTKPCLRYAAEKIETIS